MLKQYEALLRQVVALAQRAGKVTLPIYQQPEAYQVNSKSDNSPVTAADLAAHQVLVDGLPHILDIPILSEESEIPEYQDRSGWDRYWLVDPLDGTKEFISGNGEFTVNIALIERGKSVLGVVYVPVSDDIYSGAVGVGAFRNGKVIRCRSVSVGDPVRLVASRRHGSEAVTSLVEGLQSQYSAVELKSIGSSLKFCLLAEGVADCYLRLAPTCEWDTAAAQAILEAAGGAVVNLDGESLGYNQKAELLNPHFIAVGATPQLLDMVIAQLGQGDKLLK